MSADQDVQQDIQPGDWVGTRYRGGVREGIVQTQPRHGSPVDDTIVRFKTQDGKEVEHNKATLAVDPDRSEREMSEAQAQAHREQWARMVGPKG